MIEYIHHRLNRWSNWVARGNRVHGLGYPGQVAFTRLTPRDPNARRDVDYNEDASEMDQAVAELTRSFSELGDVVRLIYIEPGSVKDKAMKAGCCRDTLYARLHQAHVKIMEWLQDCDIMAAEKKIARHG